MDLCQPQPITFTEMNAWACLLGLRLRAWEVDMLRSLDRVFHKVLNEQ